MPCHRTRFHMIPHKPHATATMSANIAGQRDQGIGQQASGCTCEHIAALAGCQLQRRTRESMSLILMQQQNLIASDLLAHERKGSSADSSESHYKVEAVAFGLLRTTEQLALINTMRDRLLKSTVKTNSIWHPLDHSPWGDFSVRLSRAHRFHSHVHQANTTASQ